MKWNILLLVISLTAFISCGGSKNKDEEKTKATKAADIDIDDLKEPCDYADAMLTVAQETYDKLEFVLERGNNMKALGQKMDSIMNYGDENMVDKSGFENCSSYAGFEKLGAQIRELSDAMAEIDAHEDDLAQYISKKFNITKDDYKGTNTKEALKMNQTDLIEPCDYVDALKLIFEAMSDEMRSILFAMSEVKKMEEIETNIRDAIDNGDVEKSEVEDCTSYKKGEDLMEQSEEMTNEFGALFNDGL